jgi:dCTP deaminase
MAIKSDTWIKKMARKHDMIRPFSSKQVRKGISYGLSSYGYDIRIANEFEILTDINSQTIDPKDFNSKAFTSVRATSVLIPPHSIALGRTVEYFKIPRNIITLFVGKLCQVRSDRQCDSV